MAQLSRVDQQIFGDTGGTTEFGQIGSDSAGAPVTTKDLETIQSLDQYHGGLYDLTSDLSEPPRVQDLNSLYLLMTSQLRYIMQAGVPEWHTDAEYYASASFVQGSDGNLYQALTGDSTTANTGNDPVGDTTNWVALGLGVAQTWNTVTSSRVLDTEYTNTNNKPIEISIITASTSVGYTRIYVGTETVGYLSVESTGTSATLKAIVPAGDTYEVSSTTGISSWRELY